MEDSFHENNIQRILMKGEGLCQDWKWNIALFRREKSTKCLIDKIGGEYRYS